MGKLSLTGKRTLVGVALLQMLFFAANRYFFHFFEPHDKKVLVVSVAILGFCVLRLGPTIEELREHRAKKRSAAN